MPATFSGGSYVMTVGLYRNIGMPVANVQMGGARANVSGHPDPNTPAGWDTIWTEMVTPPAGNDNVVCNLGPLEPDPYLDPGYWVNRMTCDIVFPTGVLYQEWEWSFDGTTNGDFQWQVSFAASPARVKGHTQPSNGFDAGQCTYAAQQEAYFAEGYTNGKANYLEMTSGKSNAYQWDDASLNAIGWTRPITASGNTTPESRSVVVFSREWDYIYGGEKTTGNPGHVAWVQGVEYDPATGIAYLHTIEMNGSVNQWYSYRREYVYKQDPAALDSYYYMQFILAP
jgi:hypothetical protein